MSIYEFLMHIVWAGFRTSCFGGAGSDPMQRMRGPRDEENPVCEFLSFRDEGIGKISRPRRYCLLWFQS